MSDGMDTHETKRLFDLFKEHAAEADALSVQLNALFAGKDIVACIMAMGAVMGSQAAAETEVRASEQMVILLGAINFQIAAQQSLPSKHSMN